MFLSRRVSEIQWNLNVQDTTLRAHETAGNFFLKCRGVLLSLVFGIRYIPLQCAAIVCNILEVHLPWYCFHTHNVLVKSLTVFVTDFEEIFGERKPSGIPESGFLYAYCIP